MVLANLTDVTMRDVTMRDKPDGLKNTEKRSRGKDTCGCKLDALGGMNHCRYQRICLHACERAQTNTHSSCNLTPLSQRQLRQHTRRGFSTWHCTLGAASTYGKGEHLLTPY
jgi:hypothetical protein